MKLQAAYAVLPRTANVNCDLCSNSITSRCLSATEGCKHKICTPCLRQILRERAVGRYMVCPIDSCLGKFDVEDIRYDAIVSPERRCPRDAPRPDFVSSVHTDEFDENDYAILCERYLTERVHGGRKRKLLYPELRKDIDRLLNEDKHFKVYELLSQLRDYEMNPKKVPSFLRGTNVSDEVVEVIDLSKDDDHAHIDVEKDYSESLLVHAKKTRMATGAAECRVEEEPKVKTEDELVLLRHPGQHIFLTRR